MSEARSGGCQCGAARFSVEGELGRASLCHCRMCQKAFGSFYGPFVSAPGLVWTRGAPKYFQSSNRVRRGFCADCGTPLTFEPDDGPAEVAIGAFDEPAAIRPVIQLSVETRLPWLAQMDALQTAHLASFYASIRSYQHPDHDTETWPLPGSRSGPSAT
jgi:hypothetical protein